LTLTKDLVERNRQLCQVRILIKLNELTNAMGATRWEYTDNPGQKIPDLNDKTMTDFVGRWVEYFFNVSKLAHPKLHRQQTGKFSDDLDRDQNAYQRDKVEKVWVLLDSNLDGFFTTLLPVEETWAIIFTSYITMASKAEFPGEDDNGLQALVKKDTGAVINLEASINSEKLTPVKVDGVQEVKIKGNNVLGLPPSQAERVYFSAYANLLKPLGLGDFLIVSRGRSPNYENNVTYSVSVRK
jgi:hypothetical protein